MKLYAPLKVKRQIRMSSLDGNDESFLDLTDINPGCIGVMPVYDNYNDPNIAHPKNTIVSIGEVDAEQLKATV